MTTYPATNLRLELNNDTGEWSYVEQAYEYNNTPPPTWSGYTSSDPDFEFAPDTPDNTTPTDPDEDPWPAGYIYDTTLKQCVPDPNYAPRQFLGEPQGGGRNKPAQNLIPSNAEKERMIQNKDAKSYIDNLKDRGCVKVGDDGKLYFKKDNIGSSIARAGLARVGLGGEVDAKTNKIIQDLQRIGAIDSSNITVTGYDDTGQPIIDYASDLEISEVPGTFGIYNYEAGTADTGYFPGRFIGVTGTSGVTGEPSLDAQGDIILGSTWTNYMNKMMEASNIGKKEITSVTGDIDTDKQEILKKEKIADKKQIEADIAKMEALEKGQSFTDDAKDTYTKVTDTKTGGGGNQGFSFKSSDPKPVGDKTYKGIRIGPRAGVMAQPRKKPAVNYETAYGGADI